MVNVTQIQRGFTVFVDREVATAFEGWQKAIVSGGANLLAANLPNIIKIYENHPLVAAMGVYNAEAGTVNVDGLYNAFVPKMGADKIPISIPKIGVIKMGKAEIDSLMRYIKEA